MAGGLTLLVQLFLRTVIVIEAHRGEFFQKDLVHLRQDREEGDKDADGTVSMAQVFEKICSRCDGKSLDVAGASLAGPEERAVYGSTVKKK
jgi:hypothetical protein